MADDKKKKKEKKEKKEKTENAGDVEKKKRKRRDDSEDEGTMWDSVGDIKKTDLTVSDNYLKQDADKALDKRYKAQAKQAGGPKKVQVAADDGTGASSVVQDLLKKKEAEQKAKAVEREKKKAAKEKGADMFAGLDDGGERDRSGEELDLKGDSAVADRIGNMLEGRVVHDLMATGTFKSLSTDADPKLQPSIRNVGTGLVRAGTTDKEEFLSLGRFTPATGHGFLKISKKAKQLKFLCLRPATIFVLSSAADCDPAIKKWSSLADPTGDKGVETTVAYYGTIKQKKILKAEEVVVDFEKENMEDSLVFFLPDFAAKTFAAEDAQEAQDVASSSTYVGRAIDTRNDKTLDEKVADLKARLERGEKLTAKEKKMLERHTAEAKYHNPDDDDAGDLKAFAIVVPGGKVEHPPSGDAAVCEGFSLAAAGNWLFKNANFKVVQGHRYGFLGPNGMGKTTLLRHIAKRELPVPLDWDILLVEQEAKASNNNVVDEVMAADVVCVQLLEEEKSLMEKLENESASAEELEKSRQRLEEVSAELDARNANALESTVRKILAGLGFTKKMLTQTVQTFSGGWRMRISLAKALFMQPKLLLLDEPTNHLDLDAVLWLDNYLSEEYPHTVICVSHDADFLDAICTDIMHLDQQQIFYYRGGYSGFRKMLGQKKLERDREFKKMQDEFKALKRSGMPREKAEETVKKKFNLENISEMQEKPKDYIVKFNFLGLGQDSGIGGLNVSEVAFSYTGEQPYLLDDLEFGCDTTSRIAIVGPNGVGKSTFLNLMLKKLEPCEGEVRHAGALRVGHYHQHFDELLPLDKNGVEYLMSDFQAAGISSHERARASLGQFGLPSFAHLTKIGNLSGGQKARVAFAALSLSNPHIVVLDEPTNHLDIESVEALIDALRRYDGGVILVTHDARLIQAVDCTLWVVNLHDPNVKPDTAQILRHERGFEGYRNDVLTALADREEEIEAMAKQRAAERVEKRKALGISIRDVPAAEAKPKKKPLKSGGDGGDDAAESPGEDDAGEDASPNAGQEGKKKKMTAKERQMLKKEQDKKKAEEDAAEKARVAAEEEAAAAAAIAKKKSEKLLFDEDDNRASAQVWIDVPDLPSEDDEDFILKKKKKKKKQAVDSDSDNDAKKKKKKEKKKSSRFSLEDGHHDEELGEEKKKRKKRVKYEQSDEDEIEASPKPSPRAAAPETEAKVETPAEKKASKEAEIKKKFEALEEKPTVNKDEDERPNKKSSDEEEEEDDDDSEVDLAAFAKPNAKAAAAAVADDSSDDGSEKSEPQTAKVKEQIKFEPPIRSAAADKSPAKKDISSPAATPSASASSSATEEEKAAPAASSTTASSTTTEYKIGKVMSSEALKKKGTFQLEIDIGNPHDLTSVVTTTFTDVPNEGAIVVVVPEGITGPGDGKQVKRTKVAGAWNNGVLLSCVQLNLEGTAKDVGVLDPETNGSKVGERYEMEGAAAATAESQPTTTANRNTAASSATSGRGGSSAVTPGDSAKPSAPESEDEDANVGTRASGQQGGAQQKMGAAAKKRAKKAAATAGGDDEEDGQQKQGGDAAGAGGKKQRGTTNVSLEDEAPINWDSDDGKKKKPGRKKK